MYQTGHARDNANYDLIARDYALTPVKPCLDAEPGYEDHPNGFKPENGYLNDYDVRKSAYWALFAGACGHTYGCHDIWQFFDPKGRFGPVSSARTPWREAINLPGANQMRHARALIESRPFLSRVPDQSILVSEAGAGANRVQAARDSGGSYAFIYSAAGAPVTVDLSKISGAKIRAWWFDPRDGSSRTAGEYPNTSKQQFTPPASGTDNDWVLVLDDAAKNFSAPGVRSR